MAHWCECVGEWCLQCDGPGGLHGEQVPASPHVAAAAVRGWIAALEEEKTLTNEFSHGIMIVFPCV